MHFFVTLFLCLFLLQLSIKEREKNRSSLPTRLEGSSLSKARDDTSDIKYANIMRNVQLIMHDLEEQKLLVKSLDASQKNVQHKTELKVCKNCALLETRFDELQAEMDHFVGEMKLLFDRCSMEKAQMQRQIADFEYQQGKLRDEIKSATQEVSISYLKTFFFCS